jgi:exopolysaccharide biosynthesis polyprenyl glycosylphosphotransferase
VTRLKRLVDFLLAAVLLLVLSPLLILVALVIRLSSKGPVIYVQERIGLHSRPFRVFKFRSMVDGAEDSSGPVWAAERDPRVTPIGRWLRRWRLDELPQLFNVIKGDMSLVGPRPERPFFVDQLKHEIAFFGLREAVKPGITGWAQIRYPYGSNIDDARNKLEYDLYYVEHRSLFLDLAICFHTAKIVLFGRGAR